MNSSLKTICLVFTLLGVYNVHGEADVGASTTTVTTEAPSVTPPTARPIPVILRIDPSSDTGVSSRDSITYDSNPMISGTAEPNTSIEVFADTTLLGSAKVDGEGHWSCLVALKDGVYSLKAVDTDAQGNKSESSEPLKLTVDTTAPEVPVILGVKGSTNTASPYVTNQQRITLYGTAEPNAYITIFDGNELLGITTVDGKGNWSYLIINNFSMNKDFTLSAQASDAAGNFSHLGSPVVIEFKDPNIASAPLDSQQK